MALCGQKFRGYASAKFSLPLTLWAPPGIMMTVQAFLSSCSYLSHLQTVFYSRKGTVKMEWMVGNGRTQADAWESVFDPGLPLSSAGETHLRRILWALKTQWLHNISCRKSKDPLRHSNDLFNRHYAKVVWILGDGPIVYCWQSGGTAHWVHAVLHEIVSLELWRCLPRASASLCFLLLGGLYRTLRCSSLWYGIPEWFWGLCSRKPFE